MVFKSILQVSQRSHFETRHENGNLISVAMSVYEKHQSSPLSMDDMQLSVKHLRNSHRPRLLSDDTVVQSDALFVEVPNHTSSDHAMNKKEFTSFKF